MSVDDTIDGLINLPRRHNTGNMSVVDLLKETGYFVEHDQVSAERIRIALAQCPECVDDWILYSEDRRCDGWYIKQQDNQRYVVGYLSGEGNNIHNEYGDRLDACAIFIIHEIEGIRSRWSSE